MTGEGSGCIRHRLHFQFHPAGRYACCVAVAGAGARCESWDLTAGEPVATMTGPLLASGTDVQPMPVGDGRILLALLTPGQYRIALATGETVLAAPLGCRGMRLLPGGHAGAPAIVLAHLETGRTRVMRLDAALQAEPVTEIAGVVAGGQWLDGGRLTVVNRAGATTRHIVIDTVTGQVSAVPGLAAGHKLFLSDPHAGRSLLVVPTAAGALDGDSGVEFAVADGHGPAECRPLAGLRGVPGALHPLCFDPGGRFLALRAHRGSHSVLLRYDLATDEVSQVPGPEGVLGMTATWSEKALYLPLSTPDVPTTLASVTGAGPLKLHGTGPWPTPGTRPIASREHLTGPAGAIEAIVYGGPDWRDHARVVLALHGGPEDSWQLVYDPFFRQLAAAGVAVVALNQRGSTGYGVAYRNAIVGAWGVPDLADVEHCAAELATYRRQRGLAPPSLYGASYGAYLALLALARVPDLFDRAVIVAGFISARSLAAQATPPVLAMLDRLRATTEANDEIGVRDVGRLLGAQPRPLPPVLLVHGTDDLRVPVSQSRELAELLRSRPGAAVSYLEVPGAGHDLTTSSTQVMGLLTGLLAGGPLPHTGALATNVVGPR